MQKILIAAALAGVVLVVGFFALKRHGGNDLIQMAKGGATETEILAAAERSPNQRLTADQVIALKQAGVSDQVVVTLLRKNGIFTGVIKK